MTRSLRVVVAIVCGLFVARECLAVTQVFPPNNAPGGAYTLTFVSDGITERDFNDIVASVVAGVLGDPKTGAPGDPFYVSKKDAFTVLSVYLPVSESGGSSFGFSLGTGATACQVDWTSDTSTQIDLQLYGIPRKHVIVIGSLDFAFGCSADQWTYLGKKVPGHNDILPHELGHLIAGLYDEYFPDPPAQVPFTGTLTEINCAVTRGAPGWVALFPDATNPAGCKNYTSGLVRPYEDCRMRDGTKDFCKVCARFMSLVLDPYREAPRIAPPTNMRIVPAMWMARQPPPAQARSVRVLLRVNTERSTATVLSVDDEAAPYLPAYRRLGDVLYEVLENGSTIETGVLPGNPFEVRGYAGRGAPHSSQPVASAAIVVVIPRATMQSLLTRNVSLALYRLPPTLKTPELLTPDVVRTLRAANTPLPALGRVDSNDLKKAINDALARRGRGRV